MSSLAHRFGTDYFFTTPLQSKVIYLFLAFYLFVLVASVVIYFYLRKTRGRTPYATFGKKVLYTKLPIALVGLFLVLCRYEMLRTFSWRFWQYLLIIVYIATDVWLFLEYKKAKEEQKKFVSKSRKEKWLKKSKKGKK